MYDVIVAGAGPAGSTCARECARQGLRTLLLDKDTFPRSKPCGGAVSARALSYLDFPLPESIIERECFGARIHYGNRIVEAHKESRIAVLVSRTNFDFLLADKAVEGGAHFLPGEQVIDVQEKRDGVEVASRTASYQARFLIGADGVHSRVGQILRPSFQKDETALALVSHVPCGDQEIEKRLDYVDYYFGTAPMGYGWLFPHRCYYSVGIAGLASRFLKSREALTDLARSFNVEVTDIQGHFIPFGGKRRTIARGRILLTGDAAGFVDPFYGEGITYAILSGRLAAQAIIYAVRNQKHPSCAAAQYCREAEQRITKQLRVALRMMNLLERYPRLFLRIFFDHPAALERYLDITAGIIDYRRFQRWILTRLPFLLLSRTIRNQNAAKTTERSNSF